MMIGVTSRDYGESDDFSNFGQENTTVYVFTSDARWSVGLRTLIQHEGNI